MIESLQGLYLYGFYRKKNMSDPRKNKNLSIVSNPWAFACQWYKPEAIQRAINQTVPITNYCDLERVPTDVTSLAFADWLTDQYRLAMAKGAQLATDEMKSLIGASEEEANERRCSRRDCPRCYDAQLKSQEDWGS